MPLECCHIYTHSFSESNISFSTKVTYLASSICQRGKNFEESVNNPGSFKCVISVKQ